jgi:plastocyanin
MDQLREVEGRDRLSLTEQIVDPGMARAIRRTMDSPAAFFATSAWLCASACALAQATVEGHVQLPKSHSAPVMNRRYEVVTKGGVIAMDPALAVIYLEGSFPRAANPARAQMAQKDLAFVTPLLAVRTGTTVEFPNLDDTYHNIFSYSAAKRFDLGRYRPDERPIPSQVFDQAGLIVLHCDIHDHMRGLILVLETPYFVKSESDGSFRLAGLPAGKYTLKAWISSQTTLAKEVTLKNGAPLRVDFP